MFRGGQPRPDEQTALSTTATINRRGFLKLLAAGLIGAALPSVEGCNTRGPEQLDIAELRQQGIFITDVGGHRLRFEIHTQQWKAGQVIAVQYGLVQNTDDVHWRLTFERADVEGSAHDSTPKRVQTEFITSKQDDLDFQFYDAERNLVATDRAESRFK